MINKIYYIIRKCYKIVFIVGFVGMLLFKVFNSSVFASTNFYDNDANYNQDPSYLIRLDYDNKSNYFLKLFNATKEDNPVYYEEILNYIYNVRQFMYIENVNSSTWKLYYVNGQTTETINTHLSIANYTSIPCESYKHNCNFYYTIGWSQNDGYYITKTNGNPYVHAYVPMPIDLYTNQNVFNYARAYFEGDTHTIIEIMAQIEQDLENGNDKLDALISATNETNNFLKDESDSGVDYSVPSSSATDTTESAFDGIFMRFYNAMTSNSSVQAIWFSIPFTSEHFVLRSDLTSNIVNSFPGSAGSLKTLLNSVWYFLVGLYILKDIAQIVQDIKGGDIMTKQDENIKTTML